jgi:hypothetical protein
MLRRRREQPGPRLPEPGEFVTVRAHDGYRAAEEPRALVLDGVEVPIDEITWRASVAAGGRRLRAFVVQVEGTRLRISYDEDDGMWTMERVISG